MPGDRARSRERKLKAIEAITDNYLVWGIFKECALCGRDFLVNNYEDRRPRTPKIFKRPVCPWCSERRGKLRLAEHILVERMADLRCLNNWNGDPHDDNPDCKCVRCIANRLIINQRRKEIRENDSAG